MRPRTRNLLIGTLAAAILAVAAWFMVRAPFRRPYPELVKTCGVPSSLVYAVMLAESGFDEHAESDAGAIGLMQLLPSTAQFVCSREQLPYEEERLYEGEYNALLGTRYLLYLSEKFPVTETMLAAYNAGEGTVSAWLHDASLSPDGRTLAVIPYPETRAFVKKVGKFRKIYEFFY